MPASTDSAPVTLPLKDPAATQALAARLAAASRPGDVIALSGPLGAGKTVFARGFVRALAGPDEEVPSPTFTLAELYDTPSGTVWHLDLYRLDSPDEVWELGFEEALRARAVLIEWPERLGALLPARRLAVALSEGDAAGGRRAVLEDKGGSDLLGRAGIAGGS